MCCENCGLSSRCSWNSTALCAPSERGQERLLPNFSSNLRLAAGKRKPQNGLHRSGAGCGRYWIRTSDFHRVRAPLTLDATVWPASTYSPDAVLAVLRPDAPNAPDAPEWTETGRGIMSLVQPVVQSIRKHGSNPSTPGRLPHGVYRGRQSRGAVWCSRWCSQKGCGTSINA
jgi:hypothetical protein